MPLVSPVEHGIFYHRLFFTSEETEKKNEGISIARQVVNEPDVGINEYLLASAAAEVAADGVWSLDLARGDCREVG